MVLVDLHLHNGKKHKETDLTFGKPLDINRAGHRSAVRTVSISDDASLILTSSNEQLKVWNAHSRACVRTLFSAPSTTSSSNPYAPLCSLFAPGNRHVLVGTKAGHIEIYDIGSATLLRRIAAHDGPVWSMDMKPDSRGLITGGGDKELKFWDFELVSVKEDGASKARRELSLIHTRTLKLTDDILCVKYSPNGQYVAVGLLDSTVKVFHSDTLKFFLSLYGHKLPVLSIDISSDSTLLISGSADKSVKVWGLDFGDCHHSFRAHDESVMKVKFVPETHLFFSSSKDNLLKHWDADRFVQILSLSGHHAEVWGLDVGREGTLVVTGSNDMSIRMWEQTEEQVFLEEEREKMLEEMYDEGALTGQGTIGEAEGSGIMANTSTAVHQVGAKTSMEGMKSGEKLISAIDLSDQEKKRWSDYEQAVLMAKREGEKSRKATSKRVATLFKDEEDSEEDELAGLGDGDGEEDESLIRPEDIPQPASNPYLLGQTPDGFVLKVLREVRAAELEEALLTLPFSYASRLISYLTSFIKAGSLVEKCSRALLFLLSIHHNQITANQVLVDTLSEAKDAMRRQVKGQRDVIGSNIAALKFMKRTIQNESSAYFFGDPSEKSSTLGTKKMKV